MNLKKIALGAVMVVALGSISTIVSASEKGQAVQLNKTGIYAYEYLDTYGSGYASTEIKSVTDSSAHATAGANLYNSGGLVTTYNYNRAYSAGVGSFAKANVSDGPNAVAMSSNHSTTLSSDNTVSLGKISRP